MPHLRKNKHQIKKQISYRFLKQHATPAPCFPVNTVCKFLVSYGHNFKFCCHLNWGFWLWTLSNHPDFLRLDSIQALLSSNSSSVTTSEFHISFFSKSESVIQKFSTFWQIVHLHNPVDVGFLQNFQTIISMTYI